MKVISPCPVWFPKFGRGIRKLISPRGRDEILNPSFVPTGYIPRFGSRWNDHLMLKNLRPAFKKSTEEFRPDVVLASWLFPDGCAAARLCESADIPLILITQGSDTHQYLSDPIRRDKIVAAIARSEGVICRSADLAKRLEAVGAPPEKLRVIYNGVNPDVFFPQDQAEARRSLGLHTKIPSLLFVGNLLAVKNPVFLLRAHAALNERRSAADKRRVMLRLIGEGPLETALRSEAVALGTESEVEFLGRRPPREVANWMNASNVFCLTSENEGFPNVLLEAMACALPIVSTDVGGISERVSAPSIGQLVRRGNLEGYLDALETALESAKTRQEPPAPRAALSWTGVAAECDRFINDVRAGSHL